MRSVTSILPNNFTPMTTEQFRNKYNNTKMYLNGHNKEVIDKLKKIGYFYCSGNEQSYPFLYIEREAVAFGSRLDTFNDDCFKEVLVQDFLKDFIYDFDKGDIVIYDEYLHVITSISEDSFILSSIQAKCRNKFSVVISSDISKKIRLATDKEKIAFIQQRLS